MKFTEDNILLNIDVKDKLELFNVIASYALKMGIVEDDKKLIDAFIKREKEASTGLQDSFAIPHAKASFIKTPTVLFLKLKKPIEWETFDNKPVSNIFALLVPSEHEGTLHLQMISRIATSLLEIDFINLVKNASDLDVLKYHITKTMEGVY